MTVDWKKIAEKAERINEFVDSLHEQIKKEQPEKYEKGELVITKSDIVNKFGGNYLINYIQQNGYHADPLVGIDSLIDAVFTIKAYSFGGKSLSEACKSLEKGVCVKNATMRAQYNGRKLPRCGSDYSVKCYKIYLKLGPQKMIK